METSCTVEYRPEVMKGDLPSIPRNLQVRIIRAIETRLMSEPARYGQRLRRSLFGLWKLRVGDYRVVYVIEGRRIIVWVICHRRDAYDKVQRRWAA